MRVLGERDPRPAGHHGAAWEFRIIYTQLSGRDLFVGTPHIVFVDEVAAKEYSGTVVRSPLVNWITSPVSNSGSDSVLHVSIRHRLYVSNDHVLLFYSIDDTVFCRSVVQ